MKNTTKRIVCFILVYVFTVSLTNTNHYQSSFAAVSSKAAYKNELKKSKYNEGYAVFAIQDLNADGTPELIVHVDGTIWTQKIFTYSNGALRKIKPPLYDTSGEMAASKSRKTFAWIRRGYQEGPFTDLVEYKVSGAKTKFKNTLSYYKIDGKSTYTLNGKKITKNKYNKLYKKFKYLKFHNNTGANRNKYL